MRARHRDPSYGLVLRLGGHFVTVTQYLHFDDRCMVTPMQFWSGAAGPVELEGSLSVISFRVIASARIRVFESVQKES